MCCPTSSEQSEEPWRVGRRVVPQLCPHPAQESDLAPKTVLSDVPQALGWRRCWVLKKDLKQAWHHRVLACFRINPQSCTSQMAQGRQASAAARNELAHRLIRPPVAWHGLHATSLRSSSTQQHILESHERHMGRGGPPTLTSSGSQRHLGWAFLMQPPILAR